MSKSPAFQFYSSDFLVDTLGWSIEELGIYIRLLLYQWSNGSIPTDKKMLARIAGCSYKKFNDNSKNVLTKFLPCEGQKDASKLQNLRLEKTRQMQLKYSESQRNRANKRWSKTDATALPRHCQNDATALPAHMPEACSSSSSIYNIYGTPACAEPIPYEEIVGAYHTILPDLPKVTKLTQTRKSHIGARWKADKQRQRISWWEEFFEYIRDNCPHLNGYNNRNWLASLDWICKNEDNLVKIIEGHYHRDDDGRADESYL